MTDDNNVEDLDGEVAAGVELEALEALDAVWRSIMGELVNYREPRTEFILGRRGFLVQGGQFPMIITLKAATEDELRRQAERTLSREAEEFLEAQDGDEDGPTVFWVGDVD